MPSARAITSQNGTAPKLHVLAIGHPVGAITSQNGTAPKLYHCRSPPFKVRLPVRTALLQNHAVARLVGEPVRLPVRTALLQNKPPRCKPRIRCDYQSERHCSKTYRFEVSVLFSAITSQNGTAPKQVSRPRVELTVRLPVRTALLQNSATRPRGKALVRLPVRTALLQNIAVRGNAPLTCDYQSERHCSKTR